MRVADQAEFDVIVLGSGMAGSITSMILARHGKTVLMIDAAVHPRFAIGESTIPQTSQLLHLLSQQHDIPELQVLGSPKAIRQAIGTTSGIKRVFGFAYHDQGSEHDPAQAHQFGNVWRDENHLFRQDIDAWLMTVAMSYGVDVLQGTAVAGIEIDDDAATISTRCGKMFTARFVVDGSGVNSVLAEKYGLRECPSPLMTRTRSLFTHMVGVRDFEDVAPSNMTHPFREGTLHHIFRRGWFWVIPFGNWDGATNPLVSVGVTVDETVYPADPSLTSEQEFQQFLEMVPSVAKQFENARAVRPWVRTGRLQHSSSRTIGKRFALLSHAAGFIDPLFSRGLISTVESIREITDALLPALDADDFSEERFEAVDAQHKSALAFADRMVRAAYISWDDFRLWNLWLRVWAIGVHAAESNLGSVLMMGKYSKFQPVDNPVFSRYERPGYRGYFEASYAAMIDFDEGRATLDETVGRLETILRAHEFEIPLPDGATGHEWAMKEPLCRDVFLGIPENHERWRAEQVDAAFASLIGG
jgi:tetracycline 7-halogenase / FADH2 O2-dependent halogenase